MSPSEVEILLREGYKAYATGNLSTVQAGSGNYTRDYDMKSSEKESVITSSTQGFTLKLIQDHSVLRHNK